MKSMILPFSIVLASLAAEGSHAQTSRKVQVEICEQGVPEKAEWPQDVPTATERYDADAFGFFRIPFKYIDTGIRADRSVAYLLRASADVVLPAGEHRILLRARGASRLTIDGQQLLSTPFVSSIADGHSKIPTTYLDLGPDFRFAPPGNRESWTKFTSKGQSHRVVLETIVGGKRGKGTMRQELGETVVALSPAGAQSFRLLAPDAVIAYTDAGWQSYAEAEEKRLAALDAVRRKQALATHAEEWQRRRDAARRWLASTAETPIPKLLPGMPAHNAIDHFLAARIDEAFRAGAQAAGGVDYTRDIRPILEAKCFSCHQGGKVKGKLRLDSRVLALKGGVSGKPAIMPGHADQSELIARVTSIDADEKMPPQGMPMDAKEIELMRRWIKEGLAMTPSASRSGPCHRLPMT